MYPELNVSHASSTSTDLSYSGARHSSVSAPLVIHAQPWLSELSGLLYKLFCFSFALLAVVFLPPLASHQFALAAVLAMRISIANILTAAVCMALWSSLLCLMSPSTRVRLSPRQLLLNLSLQVTGCTGLAMLLLMVRRPALATAPHLILFFLLSLSLLLSGEFVMASYRSVVLPSMRRQRSVLIVGSGWRGQRLAEELRNHPKWNYNFHGFVDSVPPAGSEPILGDIGALENLLMENRIDEVIITLPVKSMYDDIQLAIAICERVGIQCRYSTDLFQTRIIKSRSFDRDDPTSVLLHMVHLDGTRGLKRLVDIVVAAVGLICLAPLLLAITLAIKLGSPGPIIFRQKRYGLNKRLFNICKFRTMVVHAEQQQQHLEHLNENDGAAFKIKGDPRITKVGNVLRKTSLDELPQLWNVLIGDMSLVGPRPLPIRDVSRFSEGWLMRRFSVPPGITGLWQISGRSNTSFSNWMRLDLDYIDRWSLLLDLKILVKTFPAVLKKDGAV